MKLQQLRFLNEVVRRNLNVTQAAATLCTSQSGVSKQIALLEDELGIAIFERSGKRLTGLTEPGREVMAVVARLLNEAANLRRIGQDYGEEPNGCLIVATTHTQARYRLPSVVREFLARYPGVQLRLREGSPSQIVEWLKAGEAEIGIATECLAEAPKLLAFPTYQWSHQIVVPDGHPLVGMDNIGLAELASWPLVSYDAAFAGRQQIDRAFASAGLQPTFVLTAVDADVIKRYVELGLGVGLVAEMAYDADRDAGLVSRSATHLFGHQLTRLAIRRGTRLRKFDYAFIELFAPNLTPNVVRRSLEGGGQDALL